MAMKRMRLFLEQGNPTLLRSAAQLRANPLHTLELMEFEIKDGRASWVIKTGNGSLIQGAVGDSQSLPFYAGGWIALAIPVQLHKRKKGLAPDFIVYVPDHIVIDAGKQAKTA